jgi:hypothetical protein
MKSLIALSLVIFAACSHHNNDTTTMPASNATEATGDAEPAVDPTLPSWAPHSCSGYHAVVVKLVSCEAVSQEARDAVKTKYDTDHTKWAAMTDQPQGAIEEVNQGCKNDWQSVRAQLEGKCK